MPCVLRGRAGLSLPRAPKLPPGLSLGPRLLYTDASQPPEASAELLRAPRKCSARMFNHRRFHFLIFVVAPAPCCSPWSLLLQSWGLDIGSGCNRDPWQEEGSPLSLLCPTLSWGQVQPQVGGSGLG